jgi:hypothetical protein
MALRTSVVPDTWCGPDVVARPKSLGLDVFPDP